jgi:hypothetical protein
MTEPDRLPLRSLAALVLVGALLLLVPTSAGARTTQDQADLSPNVHASVGSSTLHWDESTTLHGSGWAPGKTITVTLYAGGQVLARPVAAGDGSITATITAPHVGSSNKYVLAVQGFAGDGKYGYVQVPLTIVGPTPAISVASSQLHWGQTTTVSGVRYKPGASIQLTLVPDSIALGSATVDGSGSFSAPVTIPRDLRSSKNFGIEAAGVGIDSLFHLEAVPITIIGDRPTIALDRTTAPRGTSLTVTGQLFLKKTDVLVTLLPGYEKLGTFTIADDGTFSAKVTIPDKAGGTDPHAILVTGTGADTLFAFVTARVNLKGKPPKGTTTKNAIGIDENTPPPPGVDLGLGQTKLSLPDVDQSTGNGPVSANWLVVALVILLTIATILIVVLTARRDVRRNLRERRDHLVARFRRSPG